MPWLDYWIVRLDYPAPFPVTVGNLLSCLDFFEFVDVKVFTCEYDRKKQILFC